MVSRLPRRVVATVLAATLLAALAVGLHVTRGLAGSSPPGSVRPADCRSEPLAHVHHPQRLTLQDACVAVTGVVRASSDEAAYHDMKLLVEPDEAYVEHLPPENRGLLVADIIATDLSSVQAPAIGQRATFYGAWVINRANRQVELHPTWRITVPTPTSGAVRGETRVRRGNLHAGQTLGLSIQTAPTVPAGGRMLIKVTASWHRPATSTAQTARSTTNGAALASSSTAAELRLFLEIIDAAGVGVRWKAMETNTLGTATALLAALTVPGSYRVNVYGITETATVVTHAAVRVLK